MRIRKKSGVGQVFDQMLQQIEDQPVEFQLPEWCEKQNSLPYTTEKCGSGVIAEEDIKQGDFVIEYEGEVIDDKTCEERLWRMKRCGETNFFLCEINRDMVIDATYKGNKSRYINHSCQPNTQMQKWYVQFGADQDCYCGAIECRQKLGFKPNKLNFSSSDAALQFVLREIASPSVKALLNGKDELPNGRSETGSSSRSVPCKKKTSSQNCIGEAVRVWCARDKRYYGGVISNFDVNSRKHTIVLEDRRVETFDLSVNDWDFL